MVPSFSLRPDLPSCKKEVSKAVNLDWINNQACSLSQNIYVITDVIIAESDIECRKTITCNLYNTILYYTQVTKHVPT